MIEQLKKHITQRIKDTRSALNDAKKNGEIDIPSNENSYCEGRMHEAMDLLDYLEKINV